MDPVIRVLAFGDLVIMVDGVAVSAGPPKQRMLLALLLCRKGTEVPSGELISALWHERSPISARNNLRTYVHGLRRILGEDVIGGSGRPGYRLHSDRLWIDTERFLALCETAEHALKHDDRKAAREALAEALALRRGAAYGHTGLPAVDDEADRLDERWLLAAEQRIELDLHDGVAAELVGELTSLTRQHPYREKLIGLLMLALYRSGRQTDALAAYRRTTAALAEELGVEPGAHLAELHRAMLRQDPDLDAPGTVPAAADPPAPAGPAEMPPGPGQFVGRARERAALDAALADARDAGRLPVIAVVGPAGVGKTSLVVEWAHRHVAEFSDGQIFVDLGATGADPATAPADAMRRLLWSLGVPVDRVPATVGEAGALLRSALSGKRVLIVLDDAVSPAQVEPLLPGDAGNVVLVTSRSRMSGLIARHGAQQIVLEPLAEDEALVLMTRIIGPDRVRAELGLAQELARRCSGLPLALCTAASDIAAHPGRSIAAHLMEHRADTGSTVMRIAGDSERAMLAAFDGTLRGLTPGQQRLLALLSLVPGPSVTAEAAVVLAGGLRAQVETDLLRLVNAHVIRRTTAYRFAFHDLIRDYVRSRVSAGDGDDRSAAIGRLYDFYADVSDAADRILHPFATRVSAGDGRAADRFAGDEQAAKFWFDAELLNLVAACRRAAEDDNGHAAIRLADSIGRRLRGQGDLDTWTTIAEAGARAAVAVGDVRGQAAAQLALARIADARGDVITGALRSGEAARLARRAGWREAEAEARGSVAAPRG